MKFNIDTKEKFTVITPEESTIYDNMAETLEELIQNVGTKLPNNIIINFSKVQTIETAIAHQIAQLQQNFYELNKSFVICHLNETIENLLEQNGLNEVLNITPTESEAWDIVQMEEIERELLDGDDFEFKA